MTVTSQLAQLVAACHWIGQQGWAPATGGNMSVRGDDTICLLSESGKDKGSLSADDFIEVSIATGQAAAGRRPSAETGLHTLIYRLFPDAGAVLHTHSVNSTVLSRVEKGPTLLLQGYEMQKRWPVSTAISIGSPSRCSITIRISTRWRDASGSTRSASRCATVFCCAAMA